MQIKEDLVDDQGFIFYVQSESDETLTYLVSLDYIDGWWCGCDDYYYRKHECKHMRAVKEYLQEKHPKLYLKTKLLPVFGENGIN